MQQYQDQTETVQKYRFEIKGVYFAQAIYQNSNAKYTLKSDEKLVYIC